MFADELQLMQVSDTAITSGILSKQYERSCKSLKFLGGLLILQWKRKMESLSISAKRLLASIIE